MLFVKVRLLAIEDSWADYSVDMVQPPDKHFSKEDCGSSVNLKGDLDSL